MSVGCVHVYRMRAQSPRSRGGGHYGSTPCRIVEYRGGAQLNVLHESQHHSGSMQPTSGAARTGCVLRGFRVPRATSNGRCWWECVSDAHSFARHRSSCSVWRLHTCECACVCVDGACMLVDQWDFRTHLNVWGVATCTCKRAREGQAWKEALTLPLAPDRDLAVVLLQKHVDLHRFAQRIVLETSYRLHAELFSCTKGAPSQSPSLHWPATQLAATPGLLGRVESFVAPH